jgi:hypothetical protein
LVENALPALVNAFQEALALPKVGNRLLVGQETPVLLMVHAPILRCRAGLVKHEKTGHR